MSKPVLTGPELANEWFENFGVKYASVQGSDGVRLGSSWIWCQAYMDFDYIQAYLLEVSSTGPEIELYGQQHPSQVADYLAVIWYPTVDERRIMNGNAFDVEWRNKPYQRWPGDEQSQSISRAGWIWFAKWVEGWFEEQWRLDTGHGRTK